jgi:hypothetical protein
MITHLVEQPSRGVQNILQHAIVASLRSERQSRPAILGLEYKFTANAITAMMHVQHRHVSIYVYIKAYIKKHKQARIHIRIHVHRGWAGGKLTVPLRLA